MPMIKSGEQLLLNTHEWNNSLEFSSIALLSRSVHFKFLTTGKELHYY